MRVLMQIEAKGLDIPLEAPPGGFGSAAFKALTPLGKVPVLRAGVRVVAGEPRVRYLHTVDGARDDVIATWQERLGAGALVQTRDDAVATGRFGPATDDHLRRIGDVVVICRADTAVFATGHEPAEVATLVGLHGGETPAETAIPLIAIGSGAGR